MRIAVTGAMGFIGQEVVSRLIDAGHEVVMVDYWKSLLMAYEKEHFPILESVYRTMPLAAEVLEPHEFIEQLREFSPDCIIHLGAVVDTLDLGSASLLHNNVSYVKELVAAANGSRIAHDIPPIVFASSAAVYGSKGQPNNPYGLTKAMGEKMIMETRGRYNLLRFFNVFGANEHHKKGMASVPFKIAQAYMRGDKFSMHSPDAARDFVPVSTVAEKVIAAAKHLSVQSEIGFPASRTWDLGTGAATTFEDLDNYIMQATGNITSCVKLIPIPAELVGRYQGFTRAGDRCANLVEISRGTRQGLEETYGKR